MLDDRVAAGRLNLENGRVTGVELDDAARHDVYVAPGFVDLHVHGFAGHSVMGGGADLDGMARGLLRRGVTSFLPTAPSAPLDELLEFADTARRWMADAPADGAQPLGFNLEGPFLSPDKRGAHNLRFLLAPANVPRADLEPLVEGLRLITIAPELAGALDLIEWLVERGVAVSLGHSAADLRQARAGYAAGARGTTHLFNAMSGVDHHAPGLAVAALVDDHASVELIADGHHVHPSLWPIVMRTKPDDRLMLVSDALALAGSNQSRGSIGGLEVEVQAGRLVLAGTDTLAGSLIGLDEALRNFVAHGVALPFAAAAASRNPLALLGITDRGRLAPGQRADLVELDEGLNVRRVMRAGKWFMG